MTKVKLNYRLLIILTMFSLFSRCKKSDELPDWDSLAQAVELELMEVRRAPQIHTVVVVAPDVRRTLDGQAARRRVHADADPRSGTPARPCRARAAAPWPGIHGSSSGFLARSFNRIRKVLGPPPRPLGLPQARGTTADSSDARFQWWFPVHGKSQVETAYDPD